MIRNKGIIQVHKDYADISELQEAVDILPEGEYGYLLFDKKKNRSLPQLKFLFGYVLATLSEKLPNHPCPEALYSYFEEMYAPIHRCNIQGQEFEYFDLKNEPSAEMDCVVNKIIHHAKTEWDIPLLTREQLKSLEAQEAYVGAYADTWKNYQRKI